MQLIKRMKKSWNDIRSEMSIGTQVLWCMLFACMVLMYFSFCYTDVLLIIRHSFGIFDTIRLGDLLSFYSYSTGLTMGDTMNLSGEVPYDFWVYIPIAIWNFPTYIWECVTGNTFDTSLLAIWWGKALFLIPLIGSCCTVNSIVEHCMEGRETLLVHKYQRLVVFLFLSSMFIITGLGILTQIDVFSVFFTLNGIKAMLKAQNKQFCIWFALAGTFKIFGLFAAIPLILLKEKRVLYALRDLLGVASLTLLSKIIFYADKMKCPTTFDEKRFSVYFLRTNMLAGEGVVYFYLVAFILVAVYAYFCDYEKMERDYKNQMTIWFAYLAFAAFFVLSDVQAYWVIILAPYLALLSIWHNDKLKLTVILDVVAAGTFYLIRMLRNPMLFSMFMNLRYGIWGKIFGEDMESIILPDIISRLGMELNTVIGILNSCFVATLVSLVVILRPSRDAAVCEDIKVEQSVLWMRLCANICFVLLPIGLLVLSSGV